MRDREGVSERGPTGTAGGGRSVHGTGPPVR